MSKITKIVLLSILGLLLTIGMVLGIVFGHNTFGISCTGFHNLGKYNTGEATIDESISEIDVEWINGNVQILSTKSSGIQIHDNDNGDHPLAWRVYRGVLYIVFCKHNSHFGTTQGKDLIIEINEKLITKLFEIDIDALNANVNISNLTLSNIEVDTDSGNIEANNLIASNCKLHSKKGTIKFSGISNELDIETISSDVDITLTQLPREFDLETIKGNFVITMSKNSSFILEFETVKGWIDLFGEKIYYKEFIRNHNFGLGFCIINIETVSGTVTIKEN